MVILRFWDLGLKKLILNVCEHQESISSTFYSRIFHMKVLQAAFHLLHFGFVSFWHKKIFMQKMLVKFWWNWHLGSILSMFYLQLLRT